MDKLLAAAILSGTLIFILLFALVLSLSIYRNGLPYATTKEKTLTLLICFFGSALMGLACGYVIYTL